MTDDNEFPVMLDLGLSDEEVFFIGKIITLWGAMEYELFLQVLRSYGHESSDHLPKELRGMRFETIFKLWKKRVVARSAELNRKVLTEQAALIEQIASARNALAHGMLHWDPRIPQQITSRRVRKDEIVTYHFPEGSLADFSLTLGAMLYKIKYPVGAEDYINDIGGFHASRGWQEMMMIMPRSDGLDQL